MEEVPVDLELDRRLGDALAAVNALRAYIEASNLDPRQAHGAHLAMSLRVTDLQAAAGGAAKRNSLTIAGQTGAEAV